LAAIVASIARGAPAGESPADVAKIKQDIERMTADANAVRADLDKATADLDRALAVADDLRRGRDQIAFDFQRVEQLGPPLAAEPVVPIVPTSQYVDYYPPAPICPPSVVVVERPVSYCPPPVVFLDPEPVFFFSISIGFGHHHHHHR
jgi:hypothetical protein